MVLTQVITEVVFGLLETEAHLQKVYVPVRWEVLFVDLCYVHLFYIPVEAKER